MEEMEIRRGQSADMADILDFANFVFSQAHAPHDFRRLIPKLYGEGRDTADRHWLVWERGRIRAMVCAWPITLQVAGIPLKAAGIGTVSVHPYDRGKGYMKRLMQQVLTHLDSENTAFSYLGGQRQRYEYFGFTPSGTAAAFCLTADNLRHRYGKEPKPAVAFVPLQAPADPLAGEAYALYRSLPVTGARSREDFCMVGRTWGAELFAVLVEGAFAGYVSVTGSHVQELQVKTPAHLPAVCCALRERQTADSLSFFLPAWERETIRWLSDVAESGHYAPNQMFRIRDWAAVTRAFLRCKAEYASLERGHLVLEIKGECRLAISAREKETSVELTREEPELTLSPLEAARFLFSPMGGALDRGAPDGWLPLPLCVPQLDGC